jgi:hypothetical protein
MNTTPQPEPRLPQIDPVTFAALNTLDTFIARAPLTRAEHLEANKSLQHLVQTLEMLQNAVCQLNSPRSPTANPSNGSHNGNATSVPPAEDRPDNSRVVAEIAEEIFRNAKT